MAPVLTHFFLFFFTSIPTWSVLCAIDDQVVSSDSGSVLFRVLDENNLKVPNHHREKSQPVLKVSLHGATIESIHKQNTTTWTLQLNQREGSIDLTITRVKQLVDEYSLVWRTEGTGLNPNRELCFHYGHNGESWYNTYQSLDHSWPMNTGKSVSKIAFNSLLDSKWDGSTKQEYLSILEHLFVNTDGFAVLPDQQQPLFFRRDPNFGDAMLCFSVQTHKPYLDTNQEASYLDIKVRFFAAANIRAVNDFVVHQSGYIPKPKNIPDESLFSSLMYHTKGSEQTISSYTKKIDLNAYSKNNLIILDRDWKQKDMSFNEHNFQNRDTLFNDLKGRNYQVGVEVGPDVSRTTRTTEQYFVHTKLGKRTQVVDFSSARARNWYELLLKRLQYEDGIDHFYLHNFDLSSEDDDSAPRFNDSFVQRYPSFLVTNYVETAARLGSQITSSMAFKTQHLPILVQLSTFNQDQTSSQILKSLIPAVLTASIAGYSFIVPPEIGFGFPDNNSPITEEEFIRWVQATSLMPTMSVARLEWDYTGTSKTKSILQNCFNLHQQYSATIVQLASQRVLNGSPIVRPLWYVAPDDVRTYNISDQFMLGDDIVVAPVLSKGETSRSVYLPLGRWLDQKGNNFTGPIELKVQAPIEELPFFTRDKGKSVL